MGTYTGGVCRSSYQIQTRGLHVKVFGRFKIVRVADTQPHLMHWFKRYEDPAPPQTFLDKFFAGRDDPKQVASF